MFLRFTHTVSLLTLPLVVTAASGCEAPAPDDAESVLEELTARGAPEPGRGPIGVVTQPSAGYVADVTVAGSGCPAGSWSADISPDGQTFTLTLSAYEVKVSPGQLFDIKQCLINIGLRDPQGFPLSFVLGSIYYQGYGLLDTPGMRAARNTSYVFSTNGTTAPGFAASSRRSEIVGPHESSYLQADNVFSGRWSPCASVSNLVVNTNLMLQNDVQRSGTGYVNTATVDGALTMAFRLAWRRC
jgi:hypothetical protein